MLYLQLFVQSLLAGGKPYLAAIAAGELRAVGEKGHKQLLLSVLPRLAQHELPPASLVPQLIQLAAATDDRYHTSLTFRELGPDTLHKFATCTGTDMSCWQICNQSAAAADDLCDLFTTSFSLCWVLDLLELPLQQQVDGQPSSINGAAQSTNGPFALLKTL